MSVLGDHLENYLLLRHASGFKMNRIDNDLRRFVAFLDSAAASRVTVELAVVWARQPGTKPITVDFRISAVRGFAHYMHAIDPATEVPPRGLLSVPRRRPVPYLYSADELVRLLRAARRLRPPLRGETLTTLLGLIASTGMRLGETLTLTRDDVDLADGMITIQQAKFDRVRMVPLHPSGTSALRHYRASRQRLCPAPRTDRFFCSRTGAMLRREEVQRIFRQITTELGIRTDTVRPRIHDLRHTFAVNTLLDWQRDGMDISRRLPLLSTYLGHVEPANTYWYLSAVPELMHTAAELLEQHTAGHR
jgi:integrase/recombinase XerD